MPEVHHHRLAKFRTAMGLLQESKKREYRDLSKLKIRNARLRGMQSRRGGRVRLKSSNFLVYFEYEDNKNYWAGQDEETKY